MALKPSLTLRMGQQLRMTPQLQQAIRLLQLSSIDLELEIQEALESNFMLEEVDGEDSADTQESTENSPDSDLSIDDTAEPAPETSLATDAEEQSSESHHATDTEDPAPQDPEIEGDLVPDTSVEVSRESMSEDLPVDTSWDDVYDESFVASAPGPDYSDENYLETRNAQDITIQSHLFEQLNLIHLTESDEYIAAAIVDGLDEDGVLQIGIEEVQDAMPVEWEIDIDEIEAVLHLIQHLDPVGVAARSLKECLSIQLRQLSTDTPYKETAINLIEHHLQLLGNHDYTQLARKLRIKEDQLKQIISLIQSLNPRPGTGIGSDNTQYVEPDVMVSKKNGRWNVELNPKSAPRIRVNPEYAALIKRGDSSNDATSLKNQMQEAKWFIKSLQQRNATLLRVATKIVEVQRGFLEYGEQAMKPLVLHDIAEAVDLHESTISRVTTQKYMLTPAGVFELKYFFSSHVRTNSGGEVSSTAIRALIKELISEENPVKPLSDSKIALLLQEQNINVARRTIAKYRELLFIPPSNERKQLI